MRYNPLTNLAVHFKMITAQVVATDLTLVYVLWVALNIAWPQIECNFFMVAKTEDSISTGNVADQTN